MKQVRLLSWGVVYLALGFFSSLVWADIRLEVSEAPTSNLQMTVNAIRSAKQSLFLNIYELTSAEIADAIADRIHAGVHVELLEEGQPVGGLSPAARGIQDRLVQAMKAAANGDRFYVMTSKVESGKRRFRYNHAKYAVVDDSSLLIGSENYSPTGNPEPGTLGNRGWEVFVHDLAISQTYKSIFQSDAQLSHGDLLELTGNTLLPLNPVSFAEEKNSNPPSSEFGVSLQAKSITKISSPDTSLNGLLSLIRSAKKSLDIEQMIFDSSWPEGKNPLIAAIEDAAARGVAVRVLLNDETVFFKGKPGRRKNVETAALLNEIPNTSARIANVNAMGVDFIHNKGVLVDGNLTLVSSINWNANSIEKNREAAIVIDSIEVNQHYQALFDSDWNASESPSNPIPSTQPLASGFEISQDSWEPIDFDCPSGIDLEIKIGELRKDPNTPSFDSLANTVLRGRLTRRQGIGCSFTSEGNPGETFREIFLDLRPNGDKSITFTLEGYTPLEHKLFSIRAKQGRDVLFSNQFSAGIFNGSATRAFLGLAQLTLNELK